jgi:hypothetical protein
MQPEVAVIPLNGSITFTCTVEVRSTTCSRFNSGYRYKSYEFRPQLVLSTVGVTYASAARLLQYRFLLQVMQSRSSAYEFEDFLFEPQIT